MIVETSLEVTNEIKTEIQALESKLKERTLVHTKKKLEEVNNEIMDFKEFTTNKKI